MTLIPQKLKGFSTLTLILVSFFLAAATGGAIASGFVEETADMTMPFDTIITGNVTEVSQRSITVDHISNRFCEGVKVFAPHNRMIALKDIDGAEEAQVFVNGRCVRKVNVLRFAQ